MHLLLLSFLFTFLPFTLSRSYPTAHPNNPTVSLIHTFPPNTFVENLAVRANNQVLVTLLNAPLLYLIDAFSPSHPTLLHDFSPATALLGITESAATPDVFYLAAGPYDSTTYVYVNGSFDIWEPKVRKVTHLPNSGLPNGLTTLSARYILFADSALGAVSRVDVTTGEAEIVIRDETMAPTPAAPFGINGLRVRNGYLYYTNSDTNALVRIPITEGGTAKGKAEVLSTDFDLPDDFEIDLGGEVYVMENAGNATSVLVDGRKTVLASKESSGGLVVGPTSARFGRGKGKGNGKGKRELFVTTSGGEGSAGGAGSSGKLLRVVV